MALNQGILDGLINSALADGDINIDQLTKALFAISNKIFGVGEGKTSANLWLDGKTIYANARGVTFPVAYVDANGIIKIGANAGITGISQMAIPRTTSAQLPAGSKAMNGCIVIDSTNNRLVYYTNDLRYFIPIGTIF
jgi:hypothetical protein